MAMTSRERVIAFGLAGVVGLYALNAFAVAPLRAKKADLEAQIEVKDREVTKAQDLIKRQKALRDEWEQMSVRVDPAVADTRLSHYLGEWAAESGLGITSTKPERAPSDNKGFIQLTTHALAAGSQRSIARMMWAIANAPVPVRVNQMQVSKRDSNDNKRESSEELQVTFVVSTLCVDPDANKAPVRGGRTPAAGGRKP
jgi:hypothetical protein